MAPPQPERRVIVYMIRHAQAGNNVSIEEDTSMPVDPDLTPLGIQQAINLSSQIRARIKTTSIVLVSPLQRTLHTAFRAVYPSLPSGTPIIAYPELRERGIGPGATGSSREELEKHCKKIGFAINWGLVPVGWEGRPNAEWRKDREKRVRRELWMLGQELLKRGKGNWRGIEVNGKKDGDIVIVVVSHGNFLRDMTVHEPADFFPNAEFRSYEFDEATDEKSPLFPLIEFGERVRGVAEIPKARAPDVWSPIYWLGRLINAVSRI